MMTTYRLGPPLWPSQRLVTFGALLAIIPPAIDDDHVLTAHDVDTREDGDVEIDIRLRSSLLLALSYWLEYTTQQSLNLGHLPRG